jgi:uncharacterized membrane protein YccC
MLMKKAAANPNILTRLGMVALLLFFGMKLLPKPTSTFGDGFFDGLNGAFLGMSIALLLWAAWLTGRQRRNGISR